MGSNEILDMLIFQMDLNEKKTERKKIILQNCITKLGLTVFPPLESTIQIHINILEFIDQAYSCAC